MSLTREPAPRLVLIESDSSLSTELSRDFSSQGFEVRVIDNAAEALERCLEHAPDVVLCPLRTSQFSGLEFCKKITQLYPHLPVFLSAEPAEKKSGVQALHAGAFSLVEKPFQASVLTDVVKKAVQDHAAWRNHQRYLQELKTSNEQLLQHLVRETSRASVAEAKLSARDRTPALENSPTYSPELRVALVRLAQSTSRTILLTGEMGTGKETAARFLHDHSSRQQGPFLNFNCTAGKLAREDLDRAFWGWGQEAGMFECAHGGTLLLKNVHHLDLEHQEKIAEALHNHATQRSQSNESHRVDVRLIATSDHSLDQAVDQGQFSKSLWNLLSQETQTLPPLRERSRNILELATSLLEKHASAFHRTAPSLQEDVKQALLRYPWHGNIRELSSVLERILLLETSSVLTLEQLPEEIRAYAQKQAGVSSITRTKTLPLESFREAKSRAVHHFEEDYLLKLLQQFDGNISACSRAAGVDRPNFLRLIRKYNLKSTPFRKAG